MIFFPKCLIGGHCLIGGCLGAGVHCICITQILVGRAGMNIYRSSLIYQNKKFTGIENDLRKKKRNVACTHQRVVAISVAFPGFCFLAASVIDAKTVVIMRNLAELVVLPFATPYQRENPKVEP